MIETPYGGSLKFYVASGNRKQETVLICPGGGYSFLSPREGRPVAEAFNREGYHAVVLDYCLEKEVLGANPLKELAWSIRYLRFEMEWRDRIRRIWVAGFSAGGHLAASLGALWNEDSLFTKEEQRGSCPSGLILGYPVISMNRYGHEGSIKRLTGGNKELIHLFSLDKRNLKKVPPVFLWSTLEDEKVPAMNSLLFAQRLAEDGASCEYHMFHKGRHGMSLGVESVESEEENLHPDGHIAHWFELCLEWMAEAGAQELGDDKT